MTSEITSLRELVERNIAIIQRLQFRRIWLGEYAEERCAFHEDELTAEMESNEKSIVNILSGMDGTSIRISEDLLPFYVMRTLGDASFNWTLRYINECIPMDSTSWPGYTALHFAARFNLVDTVKLLVEKGANVEARDADGVRPFDLCVGRFGIEDIHYIISSHNIWRNILLSDGKSKLLDLVLAMRNPEDLTKFLSEIQQDINGITIPRYSPLWPGFSVLHLAVTLLKKAMRLRLQGYSTLFDKDFVMSESYRRRRWGRGFGQRADGITIDDLIRRPNELIRACLDLGANVTAQDSNGSTPIHLALRRLDLECLYFLLQRCEGKSNPTDKDNLSLLHIACLVENPSLVKLLIDGAAADLNAAVLSSFQWDPDVRYFYELTSDQQMHIWTGFTPLHVIVIRLRTSEVKEIVRMLLESGANINAKDAVAGWTPLHWLIIERHNVDIYGDDLLSQLITEDCVVDGLSYLHIAAYHKYPKMLQKLLDLGADVNSIVKVSGERTGADMAYWHRYSFESTTKPSYFYEFYEGFTPLHSCLECCYEAHHFDIAYVLISHGADVLTRDFRGRCCLQRMLNVNTCHQECVIEYYMSVRPSLGTFLYKKMFGCRPRSAVKKSNTLRGQLLEVARQEMPYLLLGGWFYPFRTCSLGLRGAYARIRSWTAERLSRMISLKDKVKN